MQVVGLDVGYGNTKVAVGQQGESPRVVTRPSGAAPLARVSTRLLDGTQAASDGEVLVEVDGETWLAGVEPARIGPGYARPVHQDYVSTATYRALATAGLVWAGERHIDLLVTGLPVDQSSDPRHVDALKRLLGGRHRREDGDIEVARIQVIPQPVGAYVDLLGASTDAALRTRILEGVVLVIDAGYYSLDWIVMAEGELVRDVSGTSLEAASVMLARAADEAVRRAGGKPAVANLENAVRKGRTHIMQAGSRLPLAELIASAASGVAATAFAELQQALRRESRAVDMVLVTGGAGGWYRSGVMELFPSAEVIHQEQPVTANARGFFRYGR